MIRFAIVIVMLFSLITGTASAQILITGETGGKDAHSMMVSANAIYPKDYAVLKNFWIQYSRGLTHRLDAFAIYGNTSVYGQTQHYVGGGSNLSLIKRERLGADVSFFNSFSVPLNRRDEASSVLVNLAVVASRPVKIGTFTLTPYSGFSAVVPIGNRADKVFTPAESLNSGVVGVAIPVGKNWSLYFEYNPGTNLRSTGIGLLRTLPK